MGTDGLLDHMHDEGVVAVLRSPNVEQAVAVAGACAQGGLHFVEVTFSVPDAADAIAALSEDGGGEGIVPGAGTVLSAAQAKSAIDAGARFVVAPTYSVGVLACCMDNGIPYIPGCMTVNEMVAACQAGCAVVKFFPASEFTPGFIKSVHAPLPELKIMPTGGINLQNAGAWIRAGAYALGVGGNLAKVGEDGLAGVTERARAYLEAVREARFPTTTETSD